MEKFGGPEALVAGEAPDPLAAGTAISVVTTFGYGGFLLGPVIVGGSPNSPA